MPRKIRKHPACPQRQCATVSHTGDPGPEAEGLTLRGPLGFVPATLRLLATPVLLLDQVTAAFAIAVPLWSFTVEVT
jgi:hypothetical protein